MATPTNRISFQGEPGANSDTACRNMFPGMEPPSTPWKAARPTSP
jgi:prephenate dehydratase